MENMTRPKREGGRERSQTVSRIKAIAHSQMAQYGTAGLSLRGIAREMGMTAPAIYNYFPRLDDLITALIVDAFSALAVSMETAEGELDSSSPYENVVELCVAYRAWAAGHPFEFQLIYGNPIPGYHAPEEITIPLARRPFLGLFRWFLTAYAAGELAIPPEYSSVPAPMAEGIAVWRNLSGIDVPDPLLGLLMSGWSRMHGAVMLELFGHIQPLVGDPEAFFRYEIGAFASRLGLRKPERTERHTQQHKQPQEQDHV